MLFDSSWIFSRLFANYGLHLPFSRKCEQEADYIGLLLMAQACYDPRAAVGIWERFDQMDSKQVAAFMSTHPSHQQRVAKIQSWLPEAELKREASDCQRAFYPFQEAVRRHQVSW
jgi:predicted Zn-dependent protease